MTDQALVRRLRKTADASDALGRLETADLLREAADALTWQEGAAPRTLSADEFEHLALMGLSPDRSLRLGEGAAERVMEACRKLETARQEGAASPAPHAVSTVCPGEDMRECGAPSPRAEGSTLQALIEKWSESRWSDTHYGARVPVNPSKAECANELRAALGEPPEGTEPAAQREGER